MVKDLWVIIVGASRYWFNYRHSTNGFAIYALARQFNISNDHILLFDTGNSIDQYRNPARGEMYFLNEILSPSEGLNQLIDSDFELDYRGELVNIDSFLSILTSPNSKLQSSEDSNILMYLSGHGGDEFFKFHDLQEMEKTDFQRLLMQLHLNNKYGNMLIFLDTCQADTMGNFLTDFEDSTELIPPNVTMISSSLKGENSFAAYVNEDLSVPVIDRFTFSLVHYLQTYLLLPPKPFLHLTIQDFLDSLDVNFLHSHVSVRQSPQQPSPKNIRLGDFFLNPSFLQTEKISINVLPNSDYYYFPKILPNDILPPAFPSVQFISHPQIPSLSAYNLSDLLQNNYLFLAYIVYITLCWIIFFRSF